MAVFSRANSALAGWVDLLGRIVRYSLLATMALLSVLRLPAEACYVAFLSRACQLARKRGKCCESTIANSPLQHAVESRVTVMLTVRSRAIVR